MDVLEAVEAAVRLAEDRGVSEAEAYAERLKGYSATLNAGRLRSVEAFMDTGIGVRVIIDGRMGFAYATGLSGERVARAVEEAVKAAKAAPRDPYAGLPREQGRPVAVEQLYSRSLEDIDPGLLVEGLSALVSGAAEKGLQVPYGYAGVSSSETAVANTHGLMGYVRETAASLLAGLTTGYKAPPVTVYSSSRRGLPSPEPLIEEAARVTGLYGSPVRLEEPRRMPVVLSPAALASLLDATLLAAVDASMIARGRSPYSGKPGELVACEELTIIDDPHIPGGDASTPFDAEGVATRRKHLVYRGVLQSIVSDYYWGSRLGTGSTGNAARAGYASQPHPSPFNIVVEPGGSDLDEMLEAPELLYVYDVRGAHTVVTETGEYSLLAAPAVLYRGGEPVGLLKGAMIAGSFYNDLRRVTAVEKRLHHLVPRFYLPHLRIEGVMVASQE